MVSPNRKFGKKVDCCAFIGHIGGGILPLVLSLPPTIAEFSMLRQSVCCFLSVCLLFSFQTGIRAQEKLVPHNQDQVPNEPRSAEDALEKMVVPEGFSVDIVASEPEIVNPVAMTFDQRGRIWITESLEYPRKSAGPGKDRIKILEDTDGDGKIDSVKVFAEGLNIPSGIAVGYGGVWVANSPDILFLQDTDGDDVADKTEVVVTGFGRDDTHELPNSLTWGPDGYLYGLNGVFNFSKVEQDGKTFDFTCAMFRIDPVTRKFEVFANGTSNPWGIAFDERGEAFVSACVIDHMWHLSEAGYYRRQAGAYPPHTWIIESVVKHKHFKAAYCGIHYFDSPAFPEAYRKQMYMGNIHGGSVNSDSIETFGGTYQSEGRQDLLQANDVWFMPVAQKTAPDGSMYVLDWYDRYHCYQDANRDPDGIDRLKGRLYRVRYGDKKAAPQFDLSAESDQQLIERLNDQNVCIRDLAQHTLAARIVDQSAQPETVETLLQLATMDYTTPNNRRRAAWTLVSGRKLTVNQWKKMAGSSDPVVRTFALRAAGNFATHRDAKVAEQWRQNLAEHVADFAKDRDLQVRLAAMVAARKILGSDSVGVILKACRDLPEAAPQDDGATIRLAWQNLLELINAQPSVAAQVAGHPVLAGHPFAGPLAQRLTNVLLEQGSLDVSMQMLANLKSNRSVVEAVLGSVQQRVLSGEIAHEKLKSIESSLQQLAQGSDSIMATQLLAMLGQPAATKTLLTIVGDTESQADRAKAFDTLCYLAARDEQKRASVLQAAKEVLSQSDLASGLAANMVDSLLRVRDPDVAQLLLQAYRNLEPANRSRVIESLTSRADWAITLFEVMGNQPEQIPAKAVNENQVGRLLQLENDELNQLIAKNWGAIQMDDRGLRVDEMLRVRRIVRDLPGDTKRGWLVYDRVCGQCHQFAGRGQQVGPALDANGRASLTQLLSNMVDPNLVIGKDYQARLVSTLDGRILSGLVVEESEQRLVLNTQGGKLVTISVDDIDEMKTSPMSLMPEGQTQQMSDQELADLMSLLVQVNPNDEKLGRLPETRVVSRTQWDSQRYGELLVEAFADFSTQQRFEAALGLHEKHFGRQAVVRTHPESRENATRLTRKVTLPAQPAATLKLGVSHHPEGDWQLRVLVDGKELHQSIVSEATCTDGWLDLQIDLGAYAGKTIELTLENRANNWANEFGYWSHAFLQLEVEDK